VEFARETWALYAVGMLGAALRWYVLTEKRELRGALTFYEISRDMRYYV
jgi:hypothetical protein